MLGNPQDTLSPLSSCLSSLSRSFASLIHLRLFGLEVDPENPFSTDHTAFRNLNVLSANTQPLSVLATFNQIKLHSNLQTFIIPYYYAGKLGDGQNVSFPEDFLLTIILRARDLPNLREVILPSEPIQGDGTLVQIDTDK